jgi:hypothetical protein
VIRELWADPEKGRIYYQLHNWGGFWKAVPLVPGVGSTVEELPDSVVLLLKDGVFL